MQLVAGVLGDERDVAVPECDVVEAAMGGIAEVDEADFACVGGRGLLGDGEQSTETAVLAAGLGGEVGVAGLGEDELAKARAGAEDAVLGALQGRSAALLGPGVGVERLIQVGFGVVDRDPARLELDAIGVQRLHACREHVPLGLPAWKVIGSPSGAAICSACSLPPLLRSVLSFGTKR